MFTQRKILGACHFLPGVLQARCFPCHLTISVNVSKTRFIYNIFPVNSLCCGWLSWQKLSYLWNKLKLAFLCVSENIYSIGCCSCCCLNVHGKSTKQNLGKCIITTVLQKNHVGPNRRNLKNFRVCDKLTLGNLTLFYACVSIHLFAYCY